MKKFYQVTNTFKNDDLTHFLDMLKFKPNGFGHQSNDPKAVCGDRVMGDFEIIYIIGGESRITVGQKHYNCVSGDVVLIPPFTVNRIETSASNPHDNYWLHFDVFPVYRQDDFIAAVTSKSEYKMHVGLSSDLISLYQKLEEEMSMKKPGSLFFFNTLLIQILIILLRNTGENAVTNESIQAKYSAETAIVDQSMDFIEKNMEKTIKIEDVCSGLYISESYLYKAFDRVLKMSPNHVILLCKMKKAEQLMKSTELSFKEISERLGFSSPYYFSNVFKKFYGLSPRDYRNTLDYQT